MPKGIALLDHRNGAQRARHAQSEYLKGLGASVYAKKPYRIIRADLSTGEETVMTKREFENEMQFNCKLFFSKIMRVALYTGEFDLIWREMEKETPFFTTRHVYLIEYQNKIQTASEFTE